ncbi:MAG TPA: hypothetical protein VNH18_03485 [Bryobacteraceae bacterium]|nr:hypothetical protein [Bryobacteraceae bacterium]
MKWTNIADLNEWNMVCKTVKMINIVMGSTIAAISGARFYARTRRRPRIEADIAFLADFSTVGFQAARLF